LPSTAYGNDINEELIEMYRTVAESPEKVYEAAIAYEVSKEEYYKLRSTDPEKLSGIQRAARFVFLNRYCFNGIYRTNRQGKFNVPFSGVKTGKIPSLDSFKAAAEQLRRTQLTSNDFEVAIFDNVGEGDFVYIDPPYLKKGQRIFAEYTADSFSQSDLVRLVRCVNYIDSIGATFLLSFTYCQELKAALHNHDLKEVLTRRTIASNMDSRSRKKELLISNANMEKIKKRNIA